MGLLAEDVRGAGAVELEALDFESRRPDSNRRPPAPKAKPGSTVSPYRSVGVST